MIPASLLLLGAFAFGACGSGRPIHYYTVELPPAPETAAGVFPITLALGHIGGPEILMDQPIAYRSGPNEIGIYQYHLWEEPPVQMLKISLLRLLRASGKYQSVAVLGSSVPAAYVLQGRLYDFEEVDSGSISALVSMEFELLDRSTGRIVWTHFYSHTDPVQGKDIPDVVSALAHNLERGLGQITSGLDAYFSSHLASKP